MKHLEWLPDADDTFIANNEDVSLSVYQVANCHYARFLVRTGDRGQDRRLIGSGTAVNIKQAMKEARNMAERFLNRPERNRPLIMVVDDDSSVRDASACVLRDAGYEVSESTSAEGALRRLERIAKSVVLVSDIDLGGGMSGLEFASTVHRLWPAMGVLLVSGGDSPVASEDQGDEFLAKPFSIDQLLDRVEAISARISARWGS